MLVRSIEGLLLDDKVKSKDLPESARWSSEKLQTYLFGSCKTLSVILA